MTIPERTRARDARRQLADHHERTWHEPYPPEREPERPAMPPEHGSWHGPHLPVEHRDDCTAPRPESVSWHAAGTGVQLLLVTTCLGCAATSRRQLGSP